MNCGDAAGNRTRITHPDGQHFDYRYDALSRFTGLRENDDSDLVSQVYHPTGERYVIGRGGAAAGWLYDGIGRLRYFVNDLSGAAGVNWTFTRSPAGQIATSASSNDGYSWTGAYNINRNYSADGLNRYSQAGTAHFTYDANGNLITTPSTVEGQTITYTYDVENRLVAASGGVQLAYDPLGRLAWTTGSPNLARFLYDGDALVAEYDYGGEMVRRYVHGAGTDEPLLQYNHDGDNDNGVSSANRRQLFADARGSIVTTTDAAGGNAAINTYDPWGIPGAANSGRFQYTGQTWLPELGLYYYKARFYSPYLGRFLQTDPIGYEGGINLYGYVGNDPVNSTDPMGTHGRGTGWSDKRWQAYDRAQRAAAARMERRVQRINGALERRGSALRAEQIRFNRVFGRDSATEDNMRAVASTLTGTAQALRDDGSNGYFANALPAGNFSAPDIFAQAEIGGKNISVNINHQDLGIRGDAGRASSSAGHEGLHNLGLDDARVNGVAAYRYGNSAERNVYNNLRTTNPAATLGNPDHLMEYIED